MKTNTIPAVVVLSLFTAIRSIDCKGRFNSHYVPTHSLFRRLQAAATTAFFVFVLSNLQAQPLALTVAKQTEDFVIFKGALQEGHAGLYYFIDKNAFGKKCDSVRQTFTANASVESYYLKLRYLITLLHHGHTRINLPDERTPNYKMGVLNKDKSYLPLQLIILNEKLYVLGDCSDEQSIKKGDQIEQINGVSAQRLMNSMLPYIPADGINQTFKYYNLYNYYYFHFLHNLFYPSANQYVLQLAGQVKPVTIKAKQPADMEKTYVALNQKSLSHFEKQLQYKPTIATSTAYLKVGSFYKGFIETFNQHYEPFLDSAFADMHKQHTKNLILDIRDNEGGGDSYDHILFTHISAKPFLSIGPDKVAGRTFRYARYAVNLSDDVKAFLENPDEFLRDDSTLLLKQQYAGGQVLFQPSKHLFTGNLYVLTNGGTFSAATNFVQYLYTYRRTTSQPIVFVGEENGGDIYSNVLCAGQGYTVKLPNSSVTVDMPALSQGTLNKIYPAKRLPDYPVAERIDDVIQGKDGVVQFVVRQIEKKAP